jgi:oxygen-independent coproporphyrinogen-3 oxidase
MMAAAGYEHYEISNWCRPGRECRHNLVYWRDGEWLGVGPGAHSHLNGQRFAVVRSPGSYIRHMAASPCSEETIPKRMPQIDSIETPDARTARADAAILALRLASGLDEQRFADRFGLTPDEAFGDALTESADLGLVERTGRTTRLTRRGRLLSNEVFLRLFVAE